MREQVLCTKGTAQFLTSEYVKLAEHKAVTSQCNLTTGK